MSLLIPGGRPHGDGQALDTETMSTPGTDVTKPSGNAGSASPRRRLIAAVVLPPVGAVLVLLAFHHAAQVAQPDYAQFAMLWAGFLCGMLPLVVLACSTGINGVTRACALAGIGLVGTVGRMLRLPAGPLGMDEFIHMRQTIETYLHGEVGHGSGIFSHFPGLHQVVSAFARLTGSPLWPAALAVIALAHILSVLAVYQLVRAVGASASGAAVGAVVYTLNPSWLYFNTSVSYESLALPVLLWFLAATVAASCAKEQPRLRYIAVAVLCAASLPMIHHLSAILLCLILALLIVTSIVYRVVLAARGRGAPREHLSPLVFAAASLMFSIVLWWSQIYDALVSYLSPSVVGGWAQLSQVFDLSSAGKKLSGIRAPFAGAQNPIYETVAGLLFPFVTLVIFLVSLAVLWRNRRRFESAPWAFAVLGAVFFLSLPMVLTGGGGEGAHRSWGYSFIGIAVVCGLAWSFRADSAVVPLLGPLGRSVARLAGPRVRIGVAAAALIALYVGGAALGTNVSARFPGSPHVGDDARSVSREAGAVAAWLAAHAPVDSRVVADRYVSQQVGSWVGRMATLAPSASFPLWDVYMSAEPVRRRVLKQVLDADVRYFVVDARMAMTRPRMGYWFIRNEPGAGGKRLLPQAAIDRFNCLPWLNARYAAGPLTVYEVDAGVLRRTMAGSCGRPQA